MATKSTQKASKKTPNKVTKKKPPVQKTKKPDFKNLKMADVVLTPPDNSFNSDEFILGSLPLTNSQVQYVSTTMQHLVAELQLFLETRRSGEIEYECGIADGIRDQLQFLLQFLKDTKVI